MQAISDQEVAFRIWAEDTFPTDLMHPAIKAAFIAGWDANKKALDGMDDLKKAIDQA